MIESHNKIRLRVFDDTEDTYWILIGENLRGYVMYGDLSNSEKFKRISAQDLTNDEWALLDCADIQIIDTYLDWFSYKSVQEEAFKYIQENCPELLI